MLVTKTEEIIGELTIQDYHLLNHVDLIAFLVQAIINQQQIIENQQKKFEELEAQIEWLKAMMQAKQ